MKDVSTTRLYLLRGTYALIAIFTGFDIWSEILYHTRPWSLMHGVACSMLGALSGCAVLGIRYPLKMLPLMLFELFWKATWLVFIAYPLGSAGQLGPELRDTLMGCLLGVVLCPLVIPWPYILEHYLRQPGDRWKHVPAMTSPGDSSPAESQWERAPGSSRS